MQFKLITRYSIKSWPSHNHVRYHQFYRACKACTVLVTGMYIQGFFHHVSIILSPCQILPKSDQISWNDGRIDLNVPSGNSTSLWTISLEIVDFFQCEHAGKTFTRGYYVWCMIQVWTLVLLILNKKSNVGIAIIKNPPNHHKWVV